MQKRRQQAYRVFTRKYGYVLQADASTFLVEFFTKYPVQAEEEVAIMEHMATTILRQNSISTLST
jgi:hypothetical protein